MLPLVLPIRRVSHGAICLLLLLSLAGVRAQDRTSESGEASILDPNLECTPYHYDPVYSELSSFPTIWQPASILPGDDVAMAKWNSILPSIPTNIPVKGTIAGDFSNFTPTYSPTDPDCWWSYHQCVTPKLAGLPLDVANIPEPNTLGYAFDDGPNCSHNAFYDYLSSQKQKATMFFIGSNVLDWPLEAQRGLADGHEICVHTWSHRYMTAFQSPDAFAELYYTVGGAELQAIKFVTGVTPTCWRPPYGDVDDRIRAIANALGLRTVIWQYDSNDWRAGTGNITNATVDGNYQSLINMSMGGQFANNGVIMLTHELNNFTMSEAVKFYPQMKAVFKAMVPIAVALNKTQPYVETDYSLPNFSAYVAGTITGTAPSTTPTPSLTYTVHPPPTTLASGSLTGSNAPSATKSGGGVCVRHDHAWYVGTVISLLVGTLSLGMIW